MSKCTHLYGYYRRASFGNDWAPLESFEELHETLAEDLDVDSFKYCPCCGEQLYKFITYT